MENNLNIWNRQVQEMNIKLVYTLSFLIVPDSMNLKGRSRRCNFPPWDKGQCPHGALFHAVSGCCKCFQQCRIALKCPNSRSPSYPTLLEVLSTPWDRVGQNAPWGHCPLSQGAKLHRLDRPLVFFSIKSECT